MNLDSDQRVELEEEFQERFLEDKFLAKIWDIIDITKFGTNTCWPIAGLKKPNNIVTERYLIRLNANKYIF